MTKKPPFQQIPSQNDASNIINIADLAIGATENALRTDVLRLEKLNVGLSQTVDNLLNTIESKDTEIAHLKQLLMGSTDVIGEAMPILMSDEEVIALKQLDRLKQISMQRDLTLDETKRFDLLVKNKRLAQGNATTIDQTKLPKNISNDDLLKLASKKIKE